MRIGCRVAGASIAGFCVAGGAAAQLLSALLPPGVPGYDTAPGVTVASRLHPDAEPPGIRAGAFVLHPALNESFGYDDNVLGGSPKKGSFLLLTQPSLQIGSDWARNAIGGFFSADNRQDFDLPAQSRTDWTASLGGSLDVGRDRLTLAAAHFDRHQDSTDLDALPTDQPVPYQVTDVRASYAWSSGRWTVTPSLDLATWHFDTALIQHVPVSQAYRDRNVLQAGVVASYELAPLRNLLLVARAIGQRYTEPQPGQPSLNSNGYQVLAGFDYDADALWRLRLLVGAEHRTYVSPAFQDQTAPIVEAELAWMPNGLTTVTATLTRSIEDAAQEGVAGYTYTGVKLAIDHELRRDMQLHASAFAQHANFQQGGTQQNNYGFGAGATWLFNRNIRLSATYDFTTQTGTAPPPSLSGGYTRSIGLLTLRLGF